MKIQRTVPAGAITTPMTGDLTLTDGDVVIVDKTKGIVMDDDDDATRRTKLIKDAGVPALEISDPI